MSQDDEPVRLSLESSGSSAALRRALGAAKDDLPTPDHVEAMLAAFPLAGGGGGGGGGHSGGGSHTGGVPHAGPTAAPAPPVAPSVAPTAAGAAAAGGALKILAGLAIATAIGGGVYMATKTPATSPSSSAASVTSTRASAATAASSVVEVAPVASDSSIAETTASASASTTTTARAPATVKASAPPPASASARPELDILRDAHAALRSNPGRALELVNEHAASYPKSPMAQEREMIRIEALLAQGNRAQAQALADAFKKAHPTSAYSQRLDSLFGK